MATLDELVVRIKADASQLEREMNRASGVVQTSTAKMGQNAKFLSDQFRQLIPAVSTAALLAFTKSSLDAAGRMNDLADRVGFASGTLSALEEGLVTSGSNLDEFAASINLMNANIGQAVSGNEQLQTAFKRLGLSVLDLQRLSPEEQFYSIVDALSKVKAQYEQTELGRAIFGRGFATMLPLIKESGGALADYVKRQQELGNALSSDKIAQLDNLGDAFSRVALKLRNELLTAINDAIEGLLRLFRVGNDPNVSQINAQIDALKGKLAIPESQRGRDRLGNVIDSDEAIHTKLAQLEGQKTIQEAVDKAHAPEKPQPGTLAKATGAKGPAEEAKDYDELNDAMRDYLTNLENERELAGLSGKALAERKAILEASAIAVKDGNLLSDEQREKIISETDAIYDLTEASKELKKKQEEAAQTAREWTKQLADGLTDVALNFDSASSSAQNFLKVIASNILRKNVTGPLADSLSGLFSSKGDSSSGGFFGSIGKIFGFADGGEPPVGVPSIVGERGPEIFVPKTAGTVIPNHALGKGVAVYQTFNMSPGLPGTVAAEVRRVAPEIAAAAKAAVFQSIERGGIESRSVNRKS